MGKSERELLESIARDMGHGAPELLTDIELVDFITK